MNESELVIRVPHTLMKSTADLLVAPEGDGSDGEGGAATIAGGGPPAAAAGANGAAAAAAAPARPFPGDRLPAARA